MRGFLIAITFLTRIPLPAPKDVSPKEFASAHYYYPLVGLLIGLLLWGGGMIAQLFFPPLVCGAILLVLGILITGGIHLDGFMDSMDGLLSARTRERMLEIMKDSRVGAHACISLAGLLVLKFALLASLQLSSLLILFLIPAISRWTVLLSITGFPYAREQGLGKGLHESANRIVIIIEGIVLLAFSVWLTGIAGAAAYTAALFFTLCFSWRTTKLLGGLTGDLYGAVIEFSEVFALLCALPFLK